VFFTSQAAKAMKEELQQVEDPPGGDRAFALSVFRRFRWPLALYLPPLTLLLFVTLISLWTGTPISWFTRDPADIADISPFAGVISNLGILGWCAAVAVCGLTFFLLQGVEERAPPARFFLVAALLTTLLMFDDFFLFHERVFPVYLHIRQRYLYLFYAAAVVLFLLVFRRVILRTDWRLLVVAFAFFSLSILVDLTSGALAGSFPAYHLVEDGGKFLGIVSWLGYFGQLSLEMLTPRRATAGGGDAR